MGGRRDDDVASRQRAAASAVGGREVLPLVAGFVLAVAATLAIFLTDNPTYLRLAVIAAAWAFVLAAVAAGRRRADRTVAAARETELRRAYERELERAEAEHREIELDLENELRREAQEMIRDELDGLRHDIAAFSGEPRDLAGVSGLQAQLAALRAEVRALGSLRSDVEALGTARGEFGQLDDLRAEMSRLRTEITELLSSELLVERIVMRTQGARGGAEPAGAAPDGRTVDSLGWTDEPPRELTGGWPAIRLEDVLGTREYEPTEPSPSTAAMPLISPPSAPRDPDPDHHSRHSARPAPEGPPATAEVELTSAERPRPQPFPRYERPPAPNALAPNTLAPNDYARRPPPPPTPPVRPPSQPVLEEPAPTGPVYVSEILAEQGTPPPPSGRRRRRYRDENTEDDVLSRVLGHQD